ncbi:MAG: ABC transporter substrate-binding protein [Gammaproteobacteria bacterium]|nr:ABC transporter substrate-binding protein [Gammaproteobacteria bacterium]
MHRLNKYLVLFLLLSGFVPAVGASVDDSAKQLVVETTDRVLTALRSEREVIQEKPERLFALVNEIILPHFDFPRMSRWVLGKHWKRATKEQRTRFVDEFRTLLINTYATALVQFSEQEVKYLPMRTKPGAKTVVVRTEVKQPGATSIPVNYRMYQKDGAWKVVDVTIDGVSLVKNYRTTYSSAIRRSGLDDLISKLAERNHQTVK